MNYNRFFGFSESPFLDTPDLRFFYPAQPHEALLADLGAFIRDRQGIAVVSGDDGVGKTMLIEALTAKLPAAFHPLILARPTPEPMAITLMTAQALGISLKDRNLVNLTPFAEAIQAAAQQGTFVLLILDDAHLLTDQHLEEVYTLSQLEYQGRQLMPIILAGRKGLVQKLSSQANQRLHGLVQQDLALAGLSFEETTQYIDHRLQQVGSNYKACFAEGCAGQLFSRTGGIPRRINQVCDQALARACQENRQRVSRDLLGEDESPAPFKPLAPPSRQESWKRYGLMVMGVLAAGLAGLIIYDSYYGQPSSPPPAPAASITVAPSQPAAVPPPVKAPPPAVTVPPAEPPTKTTATPPPPVYQGRITEPEKGLADTSPVTPPETGASQPETARPAVHQVAREDGLLKIVGTYYPDNKDIGYNAVILANPDITNEDVIYPGQNLALPQISKDGSVITLDNQEHYALLKRYNTAAQADKAGARLKALQLPYVVRETRLPGNVKVYRVFLGGYASTDELKKALALAEQK
jgi:type II secretory pathway predicted ATPase ExeA